MYVGVRQRRSGEFAIADPRLEKTATISVPKNLLENLLDKQNLPETQEYLRNKYEYEMHKQVGFRGVVREFWHKLMTQGALWHIHGIISTFTVFVALTLILSWWDNNAVLFLPFDRIPNYALMNFLIGGYGWWSLWGGHKQRTRAAFTLGLLYTYYTLFFVFSGVRDDFQLLTTISFALISYAIMFEWSRPSAQIHRAVRKIYYPSS